MSFPTLLSPWYVVQKMKSDGTISGDYLGLEYYTSQEEADRSFQTDPRKAMLFMSLPAAARVASSEGAEIRVLTSKEEANAFGRE